MLVLAVGALLAAIEPVLGRDFSESVLASRQEHGEALQELAAWCRQKDLEAEAKATLGDGTTLDGAAPRDPYKLYIPILSDVADKNPLPEDASDDQREWYSRYSKLQREYSDELFDAARSAVRSRRASAAYDLVLEAIHANPDNEALRRLLGFQKYHGRWCTAWEVRQFRAGKIFDERFGWIPRGHLHRYQQGQRYANGRWVSADEDTQLHADIANGWLVETEHYAIRTNHSLQAGVQLGVKLETLYGLWQRLFVRYYATEADVEALFAGRGKRRFDPPKFRVVFFRDRADYVGALKPSIPNIAMSVGLYLEQTRRAYFFAGEGYEDRTLYHEATHQLFHQARPVAANVGAKANFWIVEGVAMFMETLRREGDYHTLGGFDDARMHAARYRLLESKFYVPLEELTTYGMQRLQSDPRVATLYSQAAGLANFLVFYDGGRYRDALVAYLSTVYNGRDTSRTLADLARSTYPELDRQYRAFVEQSEKLSPSVR